MYVYTLGSWLTARHVIHRRAAGRLADQMSSPGDYLPVRVGPAFGIAPCGELLSNEFRVWSGVRSRDIKYVRVANVSKMASYTLILLKNFAARPKGEGLFHCKGGRRKI